MFNLSGEGFNIFISLLEKEEVKKINNLISANKYKKSSYTKNYKNGFNIFGIKEIHCFDGFQEIKFDYDLNNIDMVFEKDIIYFISIEEVVGEIFLIEDIDSCQFGSVSLDLDKKYTLISNSNKILKKGKFSFVELHQFLVYTQAGKVKFLKVL